MRKYKIARGIARNGWLWLSMILISIHSCAPVKELRQERTDLPTSYRNRPVDTLNEASKDWKEFFKDPDLLALIDTALARNQELHIFLQRVEMARNEVGARKGEYLPFVDVFAGAEVEKVGEFTRHGAVEKNLDIEEGERFPEPLPNFSVGLSATWELDIWKKLRNAKKAAVFEYVSSVEGKNFLTTNLVAEIADAYYELIALDNQLAIIDKTLEIQQNALGMVQLQKEAARATELAVRRFQAEVLKNQSQKYVLRQQIVETENKINYLLGRFPQPVRRNSGDLIAMMVDSLAAGVPSQLLRNRPDIRQAEYELEAAKLDAKVARARFFPSIGIKAGVGLEAFNPKYLTTTPESVLYSLVGDLVGPLINRNAIKAEYNNANARQLQAVFEYEQAILRAYVEVANQLSNVANLKDNYERKAEQVDALTQSIDLSTILFQSARVEYIEVLLAQREALEARMELIETRKEQLLARTNLYKTLGGGWNKG